MNDGKPAHQPESSQYLELQSPEGLDYRLEIAGIGARSYAFVVDWHIRILLVMTWILSLGVSFYSFQEFRTLFQTKPLPLPWLLILISGVLIFFLYHVVLEIALAGRTPGKRMAGVRLVTSDGRSPGIGAILLRNVFRLIDCLPGFYLVGLLSVALTRHRVRIGDLASGLVLVYDKSVTRENLQRLTGLAMHSRLKPEDQALLLDLLDRWRELSTETRIRLAEQFFKRIGSPNAPLAAGKARDQALREALQEFIAQSNEALG